MRASVAGASRVQFADVSDSLCVALFRSAVRRVIPQDYHPRIHGQSPRPALSKGLGIAGVMG